MYNAVEMNSWSELYDCIGTGGYFASPVPHPVTFENLGVMVLIKDDFELVSLYPIVLSNAIPIPANVPVILVAEKDVTIKRINYGIGDRFFSLGTNATLTLGKKGMGGTLTLSGYLPPSGGNNAQAIVSLGDATARLFMNDGVTIKNNKGDLIPTCGGVYIGSGEFTMEGGTITGNDIGVYFPFGSTGEFIKQGGTVSGNGTGNYGNGTWTE